MLGNQNNENSFQRSHQGFQNLIYDSLRSKYVTPQLYNYCMNMFCSFFESNDRRMRLHYKQSLYNRDCCEYLCSYNSLQMTRQKIRITILRNVRYRTCYLFDYNNKKNQITLGNVGDRKKIQRFQRNSLLKRKRSEATTKDLISEKKVKKMKQNQPILNMELSKTENSIRHLWELRECLDIMTRKFNESVYTKNSNPTNKLVKKLKRKQKENSDNFFRKNLQKEKISTIQRRNRNQQFFQRERQKMPNMDIYGLNKKNSLKFMKSSSKSHSVKKRLIKLSYKSMLGQAKVEPLKKREEVSDHSKKYPLTPNPRYNKINFEMASNKKKSEQNTNFLRSIRNLRKQNNSSKNNLLSYDKFLRSKIKSLSPSN